jgi:hypothetical protein
MVKRSRPPQWHLLFTGGGLLAAVGVALYVSHVPVSPGPAAPPVASRRLPLSAAAFADTVIARGDSALAELGLLPAWIAVRRGSPDTVSVRVPRDLPLTSVNLQLSSVARSYGGHVVRGIETRNASVVELTVGVDSTVTTLFRLRQDQRLQRRAGRLSLVLQLRDDDAVDRARALQQPLTLVLPDGTAAPPTAAADHEWRSAAGPALAGLDTVRLDTVRLGADGAAGVRRALWALAERAGNEGRAAAWIEAHPAAFDALEALLPRLERRGYRFVTAAQWTRKEGR